MENQRVVYDKDCVQTGLPTDTTRQNGPAAVEDNRHKSQTNVVKYNGDVVSITGQHQDVISDSGGYSSEGSSLLDNLRTSPQNCNSQPQTQASSQSNGRTSGALTSSRDLSLSGGVWPLAEGSYTMSDSKTKSYDTFSGRHSNGTGGVNKDDDSEKKDDQEEVPFSFKTLSRDQKIILACTSCTNLVSFLSLSILAPFFPIEAEKKDVNNTISGWIFGVFALVQFLTSPFFGKLLPIMGTRFMYLAGLFSCTVCTLLFGILDLIPSSDGITTYVTLCFLVRIFLALACTAISNAGFVMLVKAFPDNVGTVFGIGEIFTGVGMVTGPAMGGFLYGAGGYILPFAVIAGLCFVSLPIIYFVLPVQDDSYDSENDDMSMRAVLCVPKSVINSVVVVVGASIWAILDPTLEPHLRVYGLGPEIVGVLFLLMAAFYSVTSPIWGWMADRLPDSRIILIIGFLLASVGLLLLGPSPALGFDLSYNELWLTIISLIILGVASSMVIIPTYDIYISVLDSIGYPENTRTYGMVSGLWVSMYALGDFAGPSLGGFLFEEIGFEWLATWVALVCVLTAVLVGISWVIEVKVHCHCLAAAKDRRRSVDDKTPILQASASDVDVLRTYPPKTNLT